VGKRTARSRALLLPYPYWVAQTSRDALDASLTNMVTTSLALMGICPDSPAPLLRPSPATGHDAAMCDVEDPDLGYDADICPYQPSPRGMRAERPAVWEHAAVAATGGHLHA
jgi:hypothetical protein